MAQSPSSYIREQSAQGGLLSTHKVLRNTYALLGMTLVFSALAAAATMAMGLGRGAALAMMIGGFIMLFVVQKMADSAKGLPAIFVFAGLMGGSLGPMLSAYLALANGPMLIMQALAGTAVVFFSLSAYVLTTKKDFSFMGGFLMVGMVVAMIAMIAMFFFNTPFIQMAWSAGIVLLMSGFILFDTSRIIHGGETNYIRATVALYLNIYNLFVNLLALLGMGSDD
ncbi:Bax inhibitor-1/YccA family protein [Parendozoicomonas haliclonae]|uniref:Modulator of FtsH protease YccA n=1 Tax=Parendozoicomonas haliclonae TaxID=1960125 RepID=A0A1X7AM70_9GAMM|nr:Bax inhibitor-1/YccA family protein [Parendozoicomonas haliclonae]SMA48975.1 Modulator of FtsH protease YccA [Parendozoicomonas haliclonae]